MISWTSSTDNLAGNIVYIVYRNSEAIVMTENTSFWDSNFSLITDVSVYSYDVVARDLSNNRSTLLDSPIIKNISIR